MYDMVLHAFTHVYKPGTASAVAGPCHVLLTGDVYPASRQPSTGWVHALHTCDIYLLTGIKPGTAQAVPGFYVYIKSEGLQDYIIHKVAHGCMARNLKSTSLVSMNADIQAISDNMAMT